MKERLAYVGDYFLLSSTHSLEVLSIPLHFQLLEPDGLSYKLIVEVAEDSLLVHHIIMLHRKHHALCQLLVLTKLLFAVLDQVEIRFPFAEIQRAEQLFFLVIQLDPRPEVVIPDRVPQLQQLIQRAQLVSRVGKVSDHVLLHGFQLLAEHVPPGDQSIVKVLVHALKFGTLAKGHLLVEVLLVLVQVLRAFGHFKHGGTDRVYIQQELFSQVFKLKVHRMG